MTFDPFSDKDMKSQAARFEPTPLCRAMMTKFHNRFREIAANVGTTEYDKIENAGRIQGFNMALAVFDDIFAEPRPVIRDVPSSYADPEPNSVQPKREKNERPRRTSHNTAV